MRSAIQLCKHVLQDRQIEETTSYPRRIEIHFITPKTLVMANDKLQIREWFSRLLINDPQRAGLTVDKRRQNAEKELPKILLSSLHGTEWEIFKVFWKSPIGRKTKHRMTVVLREKRDEGGDPPPTDATLPPKPTTPPPSM
jgi:hypothetical protein